MKTAYDNFHKFSNIGYKTAYNIYKNNITLFFLYKIGLCKLMHKRLS